MNNYTNISGIPRVLKALVTLLFVILFTMNGFTQETYWEDITTEKQFYDSMYAASDSVFTNLYEFPFLLTVSDSVQALYKAEDSINERRAFIRQYFNKMNPNPLLLENDFVLDFIRRLRYNFDRYYRDEAPFFDDRGKYFLKFGEPTDKYTDSGGRKICRFLSDRFIHQFLGELYRGLPPPQYYEAYANETWAYRNISTDFVIHFVKAGSYYEEVDDIGDALQTGIGKNAAWYWSDLFQARGYLTPAMTRTSIELQRHEIELKNAAGSGIAALSSSDILVPDKPIRTQRMLHEQELVFEKVDMPVSIFYPVNADNLINLYHDIAQFRGPDGKTRVEITMLSPLREHMLIDNPLDNEGFLNLRYEALVRDIELNTVAQESYDSKLKRDFLSQMEYPNTLGTAELEIPAESADITLQVLNINNRAAGYVKLPVAVRDFSNPELTISDIRLYKQVTAEIRSMITGEVLQPGDTIIPYPFRQIDISAPLHCYFEIYNIMNSITSGRYHVDFSLITDTEAEGILSKFRRFISRGKKISLSAKHERLVTEDSVREQFAVDLSEIPPGSYLLEISVKDAADNSVTAAVVKPVVLFK